MRYVYIDTATHGEWLFRESVLDPRQPHMIRLATATLAEGEPTFESSRLIKPEPGWDFTPKAFVMNGISRERCELDGIDARSVLTELAGELAEADAVVAFNMEFHRRVIERAAADAGIELLLPETRICAMRAATKHVKKYAANGRGYAWPKQTEAYTFFTGKDLGHPADVDPILRGLQTIRAVRAIHQGIMEHDAHAVAQ